MKNLLNTNLINNKVVTEQYIEQYRQSTKNAVESILNMGEAVSTINRMTKSGELTQSDLEYFCQSVGLDSKGSTFRKYKQIGENAEKFRLCMTKLPATFSVLYEMTTLDPENFKRFVTNSAFSPQITLNQFKEIINKSAVLNKNKYFNPPQLMIPRSSIGKVIQKMNRFSISIVRNLSESDFHQITQTLTEYRNKGWIVFDDLEISQCIALENDFFIAA